MKPFWHSLSPLNILSGLTLIGAIIISSALGWWLTRGDWVYPDQIQISASLDTPLANTTTVGQSFVAFQAGLKAIEVNFAHGPDDLPVTLYLQSKTETSQISQTIRQTTSSTTSSTQATWTRFDFDPLPDSRLTNYYFWLEAPQANLADALTLHYGPAEAYLDGALYLNGKPQEKQLAFRLVYDRSSMAWDFLKGAIKGIPRAIILALLILCPGGALLAWLWPDYDLDWFAYLTLTAGLSIVCFPILVLWAKIIAPMSLGPAIIWGLIILSALTWAYKLWTAYRQKSQISNAQSTPEKKLANQIDWEKWGMAILLIFLTGLIISSRIWLIRNLTIPLWGDSYQHTLIVQLLHENGGLFDSWQPYSFSSTFTYHFGFHTFTLFLYWLLQLPMPQTVLLSGQLLNALAILLLYPLAYQLSGKQVWAGLGAMVVAGLASDMPAFYVNWGRYTQLTGQVILPVAALLIIKLFQTRSWSLGLLAMFSLGGLFLSHYRVTILLLSLVFLWLLLDTLLHRPLWLTVKQRFLTGCLFSGGTIILIWPWLYHLQQGFIPSAGRYYARQAADPVITQIPLFTQLQDSFFFVPTPLQWLALFGLLFGLRRSWQSVLLISLWTVALILIGKPFLLALSGAGLVTNFTIQIALYIPISLSIGLLIAEVIQLLNRIFPPKLTLAFGGYLTISLSCFFTSSQLNLLDRSSHAIVTHPDQQAALWIREHISDRPSETLFYVDGFEAFNNSVVVGSDGGWWLPLLAKRQTSLPPLSYVFELAYDESRWQWIRDMVTFGKTHDLSQNEALDYLLSQGITHIYIGQRHGRVGNPDPPLFSADLLLKNPRYRPIYHEDRVWIFELQK